MSDELVVQHTVTDASTHAIVVNVPGTRDDDTSPPFDVSKLAGARFVGVIRTKSETAISVSGCVKGPADRFAPGIENVLFEHATYRAIGAVQAAPRDFVIERSTSTPQRYERLLRGRSNDEPLTIHHVLTFTKDESLLLCTAACRGASCEKALLTVSGTPPDPPSASLLIRAVFGAFAHPVETAGVLAALGLAIVALILKRRPYPHPN